MRLQRYMQKVLFKVRYMILFLFLALSTGPPTEQKHSKCLKEEQSSPLPKLTTFIKYRKENLTLGNQIVSQVNHNKNRPYTLSQQDHNQRFRISPLKTELPILHAKQIYNHWSEMLLKPILLLNTSKTYRFLFSGPLTKI